MVPPSLLRIISHHATYTSSSVFIAHILSSQKAKSRPSDSIPEPNGLSFIYSNSILICIFSVGMRLLLVICHLIAFDHRIILLRRYRLRQGFIQQACCIKVNSFQVFILGIDTLGAPNQRISHIGRMLCKQRIIKFHAQFRCQ